MISRKFTRYFCGKCFKTYAEYWDNLFPNNKKCECGGNLEID